jgi:hypothetical protein
MATTRVRKPGGKGQRRQGNKSFVKPLKRSGPHRDIAPDPVVQTKKPFNPFNLKARIDEAKRGVGPGG